MSELSTKKIDYEKVNKKNFSFPDTGEHVLFVKRPPVGIAVKTD
ncbi:MAG: hypothetical protein QW035_00155 [Candidatus Anstonellales archaeon]